MINQWVCIGKFYYTWFSCYLSFISSIYLILPSVLHSSLTLKSALPTYTTVCFYDNWCYSSSHPAFSQSLGTTVDRTVGTVSGQIFILVISRPSSATAQMSPYPLSLSDAILRPGRPFKLATFNMWTPMGIGKKTCLACTLETLDIDVCCIRDTRIQDSISVIRLTSSSNPLVKFYLLLSGDVEFTVSGMPFSGRIEAALYPGRRRDKHWDLGAQAK